MIDLKYSVVDAEFPAFFQKHTTDACFDLTARTCELLTTDSGDEYIMYKLNVMTEIPKGYCALVFPRSSISGKDLILANCVGVIDADYRGEWQVRFKITREDKYEIYNIGERVAQVMFVPVLQVNLQQTNSVSETDRGVGGFGSTGV